MVGADQDRIALLVEVEAPNDLHEVYNIYMIGYDEVTNQILHRFPIPSPVSHETSWFVATNV